MLKRERGREERREREFMLKRERGGMGEGGER